MGRLALGDQSGSATRKMTRQSSDKGEITRRPYQFQRVSSSAMQKYHDGKLSTASRYAGDYLYKFEDEAKEINLARPPHIASTSAVDLGNLPVRAAGVHRD